MVLALLVVLVVLVLLTFSVRVTGSSMSPTLRDGDRVLADPLNRGDVRRFDLVEATAPDSGTRIVKRVVGLPGDRLQVRGTGASQQVLVRPRDAAAPYVVSQETWSGTTGRGCCDAEGRSGGSAHWVVVPADSYWLAGDNWTGSTDSRVFGFVSRNAVGARLVLRVLPVGDFGRIARPHLELLEP